MTGLICQGDICHSQVRTAGTRLPAANSLSQSSGIRSSWLQWSVLQAAPLLTSGAHLGCGACAAGLARVLIRSTGPGCGQLAPVTLRDPRRHSGRRRLSPSVLAACVGVHGRRNQAQRWPAVGDCGRLPADHLQPADMRAEKGVHRRVAWRWPAHAIGSAPREADPSKRPSHHGRRCMPRPVRARLAVASIAVQVGQSSSPRHSSPSENVSPFRVCQSCPHLFDLARSSENLLIAVSRLVAPRRRQASRTYATCLHDHSLFRSMLQRASAYGKEKSHFSPVPRDMSRDNAARRQMRRQENQA